jgi:hypothetical protein
MSCTSVFEKSKLTETTKGETGNKHSQEHDLHSDIKGIKKSSWQAKQSIPHTTVKVYGECMEMSKDCPKLW